jgi:gamma-glutamylcyclotransferase (GGCT)/AIG2-like uncharacterized protein YtfP
VAGVTSLHVAISDNNVDDIARFFPQSLAFIDAALTGGGRVLVHCSSGASRSTTVLTAYLMQHTGRTLRDALFHVSARRPVIVPSTTFFAQLQQLEQRLRSLDAASSASMEDYNVLQLRAVTGCEPDTCRAALLRNHGVMDEAVTELITAVAAEAGPARTPSITGTFQPVTSEGRRPATPVAAMPDHVLLFAYGTLMRGYGNHNNLMQTAEFCGLYRTAEDYALFAAGVPNVHPTLRRHRVRGELFRVPRDAVPMLDRLEVMIIIIIRRKKKEKEKS